MRRFRLTSLVPTESQVQGAFFQWCRGYGVREHPELKWIFAIPNGGARDPITGANLKREGVKRGVLDICLPVARCGYHGLFMEMKKPGEKMTPEQQEFSIFLKEQGYSTHVVNDFQVAIKIVREYLG